MFIENPDIVHHFFGMRKNAGIHSLQNEAVFFSPLQGNQKGVMDIPAAIGKNAQDGILRGELRGGCKGVKVQGV